MKNVLLTLFILMGLMVLTVQADSESAVTQGQKKAQELEKAGYITKAGEGYRLDGKNEVTIIVTLYRGNEYKIIAAGDADITDLEMNVYTDRMILVGKGDTQSNVAVATVTPDVTGFYRVVVKSKAKAGDFVLVMAYK